MNKPSISVVIVTRNRNKELSLCLKSILAQSQKIDEIVVVDNASSQRVKKTSSINVIRSETNLGGAGGRNLGLLHTKGQFVLFMDDDAVADRQMVKELIKVITTDSKIGIVQPKIYEMGKPDIIQGVGHGINLKTGRVFGIGVHQKDVGQFEKVIEIPMAGCTWLVRRDVFDKIGDYDEEIFIPYEDSDFSIRARKAGYKIFYVPKSRAWHTGAKKTFINPWLQWLGITTPERSFRVSKNKIIFMKKHAQKNNFLVFMFFYEPIYIVLHSLIILMTARFDVLSNYWKGIISGIDYSFFPLKLFLISLVDPVCRVIDTSGKTILDVACGGGLPMQVLKEKIKFKFVHGVDLFKPYINECRRKGIHDSYSLADVRNLPFENKSFDIVIALQVLEHIRKDESLRVLDNLEKIAKKQVIISMPIGRTFHPAVDGNRLQLHKSGFMPDELIARGYKVIKMGRSEIEGIGGLIDRYQNGVWKKLIYSLILLVNWLTYFIQPLANYYMVAYKNVKNI
ncbi:MAG: glycosyltransferase [Patescibacteria group bacterium]